MGPRPPPPAKRVSGLRPIATLRTLRRGRRHRRGIGSPTARRPSTPHSRGGSLRRLPIGAAHQSEDKATARSAQIQRGLSALRCRRGGDPRPCRHPPPWRSATRPICDALCNAVFHALVCAAHGLPPHTGVEAPLGDPDPCAKRVLREETERATGDRVAFEVPPEVPVGALQPDGVVRVIRAPCLRAGR